MPSQPSPIERAKSATEEVVGRIWERVLNRQDVRIDDDFITLGGDSVMMMVVLAHVRESFGIDIPPAILLELEPPSLENLCAVVDRLAET